MGKKCERQPPAAMKAESELTPADREELEMLQIGTGPFNKIITDNVAFLQSDGWTVKKKDEKHGIVMEVKPSPNSNKQAIRFTATVPNCNAATLEHVMVDDKNFDDDPEASAAYKYDRLLTENHIEKRIGGNVTVQRTNYNAPVMFVSPRQLVSYATLGCLLDPAQQAALKLRPKALRDQPADAQRTDHLMAFMQCSINYTGSEGALKKGHERGFAYYYAVLAQEEPDGSVTLTVCIDMDPAGKLPVKIVDAACDEQFKKVQLIRDLMIKLGCQKHICDVYQNTRDFPCRNDI